MPKAKKPLPDGSVLLTIFNPYGMPSSFSSILGVKESERNARLMRVFRWLGVIGITISEVFAKRTERAIIVDVRDTEDPGDVGRVIGMHKWSEILRNCPTEFKSEVSHIYRCTSTSFEYLQLTLGFEMLDIDVQVKKKDIFANPYPAQTLPINWPRAEGPMSLYVRPKVPVAPAEVDDFLAGIDLPFPQGAPSGQPPSIPSTPMAEAMIEQTETPLAVTIDIPVEKEGTSRLSLTESSPLYDLMTQITTCVEPNDDVISPDVDFEMEEEELFKKLNMKVSEQLARYNYQIPSQNIIPDIKLSQEDLKANCEHEDLKPRITSCLDRKPSKSELDEFVTRYDYPSATKKEAEDVKVPLPLKREYDDEDTRESKRHRS